MSLFGKLGRGALGFATGGLSELGYNWNDLNRRGSAGPGIQQKPITAADVGLVGDLEGPLKGAGAGATENLESALGRVRGRFRAGQARSGRGVGATGDYFDQTLNQAGTMGQRGIEDRLYGALGGASYQDVLGSREHERNMALANEIAAINSPTILEQIFGGAGTAGKTGLQFKGLYDALGSKRRKPSYIGDYAPTLPEIDYGF